MLSEFRDGGVSLERKWLEEHRVMDIVKQIARTDLKQDNRRRAADLLAAWGGKTSSEKCQDVKERVECGGHDL